MERVRQNEEENNTAHSCNSLERNIIIWIIRVEPTRWKISITHCRFCGCTNVYIVHIMQSQSPVNEEKQKKKRKAIAIETTKVNILYVYCAWWEMRGQWCSSAKRIAFIHENRFSLASIEIFRFCMQYSIVCDRKREGERDNRLEWGLMNRTVTNSFRQKRKKIWFVRQTAALCSTRNTMQ